MFAQYYLRVRAGRAAASWVKTEDDMPGRPPGATTAPPWPGPAAGKLRKTARAAAGWWLQLLQCRTSVASGQCGHGRDNRVVRWDTALGHGAVTSTLGKYSSPRCHTPPGTCLRCTAGLRDCQTLRTPVTRLEDGGQLRIIPTDDGLYVMESGQ